MRERPYIIDVFVNIVDNYGDMGFACEFIQACRNEYDEQYRYIIWTNNAIKMQEFARQSNIPDIEVVDIVDFWYLRKSAIWISLLHAPIPDLVFFEDRAIILRIDYLSLDPTWIIHNEREHIESTSHRQIIELIPSPLFDGAGLIPDYGSPLLQLDVLTHRHICIFAYTDSLDSIDLMSFPDDTIVYIFGKINSANKNIISLDFLPSEEFYSLLDSSEFVIVRGEVTFAHMIQNWVPFFWNMYSNIGWFPIDQSEQFLSLIGASTEYRKVHNILNIEKSRKISYLDCVWALSHTRFPALHTKNLIHTVKKYIDRFNNSI
jgi:hypothetical protein